MQLSFAGYLASSGAVNFLSAWLGQAAAQRRLVSQLQQQGFTAAQAQHDAASLALLSQILAFVLLGVFSPSPVRPWPAGRSASGWPCSCWR